MANKHLSMQKLRQILLLLERGYSERTIAKETHVSRPTIHLYALLFAGTGKDFNTLFKLTDQELFAIVRDGKVNKELVTDPRKMHFLEQVDYFILELKKVGVTRYLLWQEYLETYPSGFQYSRFCELLDHSLTTRNPTMRFTHTPGEMVQVDFAGSMLHYVDRESGEVIQCPVLVAVLPFSGYSYIRALPNATLPQVVKALNLMLDYFGGAPLNSLSDNMKQWVTKTCRYEPSLPLMLEQWALHNHIGILATRPVKPKDKASVENQVLITYRRIYALLRKTTFYSLEELNKAIQEKLEAHHQKNFQKKTYSRLELFNAEEKELLQSLPATPYLLRHYTKGKVYPNYHVVVGEDWHFYSVPWTYIGKEVRIVYDSDLVEIYHNHERIAFHPRSYKKHGYSTRLEHMPENHKHIAEQKGWNPDYYLKKASENGPCTRIFFDRIMESKITIHQAYGPCLGILRLITTYSAQRVEAACQRALQGSKYNYGIVKTILENKMDLLEKSPETPSPIPSHNNLRGQDAYKQTLFDK
jgi:transposase